MNLKRNILTVVLTVVAVNAYAAGEEQLAKEITIEKEIIPEQRAATRLGIMPKVNLPAVTAKKLTYGDRSVTTRVPSTVSVLEPVSPVDTSSLLHQRGYVDLGYFPAYNAALSAGYRIVDNRVTRLNAWTQYDGFVYDGENAAGEEVTLRNHAVTAGVGLRHKVGCNSTLDAGVGYSYSRFNQPVAGDDYTVSVNRLDVDAAWSSVVRGLDYTIGIRYGYFGYGKDGEPVGAYKPARENRFAVSAHAAMPIGISSYLCLDVDVSCLGYNQDDCNTSLVSVTPSYLYRPGVLTASIGAKVEVATNTLKMFHIAPEITLDWTPSPVFATHCRLSGGEHQNTLGSLYGFTRYADPGGVFENSSVPFALDACLDIGAWKGLSVELFGGYAVANDWLMPFTNGLNGYCAFTRVDIKGWHVGAAVNYEYRDLAEMRVSYETAPHGHDRGYYLWRDRARYVIDASLTVHPMEKLDVTAGYGLRAKRKMTSGVEERLLPDVSLGDMENLSVGALYRVDRQLSVFARLENILDNRCMLICDIPAQGFTGLVGIGYKF